jgi:hypothetical protein
MRRSTSRRRSGRPGTSSPSIDRDGFSIISNTVRATAGCPTSRSWSPISTVRLSPSLAKKGGHHFRCGAGGYWRLSASRAPSSRAWRTPSLRGTRWSSTNTTTIRRGNCCPAARSSRHSWPPSWRAGAPRAANRTSDANFRRGWRNPTARSSPLARSCTSSRRRIPPGNGRLCSYTLARSAWRRLDACRRQRGTPSDARSTPRRASRES